MQHCNTPAGVSPKRPQACEYNTAAEGIPTLRPIYVPSLQCKLQRHRAAKISALRQDISPLDKTHPLQSMAAQGVEVQNAPDVLMIGTGEYTTGFGKESSKTDKGAGGLS